MAMASMQKAHCDRTFHSIHEQERYSPDDHVAARPSRQRFAIEIRSSDYLGQGAVTYFSLLALPSLL